MTRIEIAVWVAFAVLTVLARAGYDRSPRAIPDGDGGTVTWTPPERFGAMA